jgi:hypothetical protein
MDALSIRDAYREGYEWGWSLASWNAQEIQFGMEVPKHIDWVGIGRVDSVEAWLEAFDCVISAADESARCYSPFEFTAAAINERDEVYGECASADGWDAFERGSRAGAIAYRRKFYPIRELRKDLREFEREAA